MLNKERLGLEIKRLRKNKKFTQIQLAHGICNQSEISRIEAGDFFPSIEVLYLISNKLSVPINYFFEILSNEEVEETKKIRDKVWKLSQKKEYLELYNYLLILINEQKEFHPEFKNFLMWKKYLAEYYLKKIDERYYLTELFLLLKENPVGLDTELSLHIKNSAANIYAEAKNYEKSIKLYKEILNEDLNSKGAVKLKVKVYYNLGKLLYTLKDYRASLEITENGINLAKENADMTFLGHLYYQAGAIKEELKFDFLDVSASYKNSLFFFDILNLEIYKKIILDKKEYFIKTT